MRRSFFIAIFLALVLVACSGPADSDLSLMSGPTGRITSVSPASGAIDVAVDSKVQVTFRGAVRPGSSEQMLTLTGPGATPVPGTVSLSEDSRTVTFEPERYLSYGTHYTATVDASDLSPGRGQPPQDFSYSWSFTTRVDPVVTVEVRSHRDGQSVFGPRSVVLAGLLASGSPITEVVVRHGGQVVADVEWDQDSFSAQLLLRDNDQNLVEVLAKNEAGKQGSDSLELYYPFTRLETYQPASTVLGQNDFSGQQAGTSDLRFQNYLRGNPAVHDGWLLLPDNRNNRVKLYQLPVEESGDVSDSVLGQSDAYGYQSGNGSDKFHGPRSAVTADGKLLVVDRNNSRVLIWNGVPTSDQPADVVVGQADFGLSAAACQADRLAWPESAHVIDGKLIVADSGNNRVLIWNSLPVSHGEPADLVLGQADFSHCQANDSNGDGSNDGYPTDRTLHRPTDVWSDGHRLLASDTGNHRVLIWEGLPAVSQAPASAVLGQSDLSSNRGGTSASALYGPTFLASNGNQVFVADTGNHRVMIWDLIPTDSGTAADHVLGHPNFSNYWENDDGYNWGYSFGPSAPSLYAPAGLRLLEGGLLVADGGNARYLVFQTLPQ
jgi:hypothetical protein